MIAWLVAFCRREPLSALVAGLLMIAMIWIAAVHS